MMQKTNTMVARLRSVAMTQGMQILGGVILLFACAQMTIPLKPVPITLHTVAVLLIGLTYTRDTAIKTLLSYIGLGALGAPVFAGFMSGIPYMMGPTGGYLLGFVAAVALMATLRVRFPKNTWTTLFALSLAGSATLFFFGVLWLSQFVGADKALALGFYPFILPGFLKAGILVSLLKIRDLKA